MNFWNQVLGAPQAPAPAAPQQPAPAYPGGWSPSPFFTPQQPVQQAPVAPQQVVPQQQDGQWGTIEGSIRKARSASLTETCPECNSGDFFRPQGNPNAMPQCYTCGYNPRFGHTTAGGGMPSDASGPAQPSRQIASGGKGGVSNFQPQNPVAGRIG